MSIHLFNVNLFAQFQSICSMSIHLLKAQIFKAYGIQLIIGNVVWSLSFSSFLMPMYYSPSSLYSILILFLYDWFCFSLTWSWSAFWWTSQRPPTNRWRWSWRMVTQSTVRFSCAHLWWTYHSRTSSSYSLIKTLNCSAISTLEATRLDKSCFPMTWTWSWSWVKVYQEQRVKGRDPALKSKEGGRNRNDEKEANKRWEEIISRRRIIRRKISTRGCHFTRG